MAYAICLSYNIENMRPQRKVKIKWSPEFAYAIGLLTTDGNLSKDGRHMDFTSKDLSLIKLFKKCLGINNKIGRKTRAKSKVKKYYNVQFGDVIFYKFLLGLGLHPAKSKTLSEIDIPDKHVFDFLRGHLDGDGTFYSYYDPRWKSSFMFYTVFISASKEHLDWIRNVLLKKLKIKGHMTRNGNRATHHLKYAKSESMELLQKIYYNSDAVCLKRKRLKIEKALREARLNL